MKRSLSLFAIGVLIVAIAVVCILVYSILWVTTPGDYQRRFDSIKDGMSEQEVDNIMGSEGDVSAKIGKYPITGNNRQRVWHVKEKGQHLWMIIVFDRNSRVVTKEIEQHSVIFNDYLFKDL